MYDLSLSDSFNLMDPFETQNEWINLYAQSFLHFRQSISWYSRKLSFIYTRDLIPIEGKSIPFKFFLTFRILFASFHLENLTITLFGPLPGNQWQSSMFWRTYFDTQIFEQLESCVFQFSVFHWLGEAT